MSVRFVFAAALALSMAAGACSSGDGSSGTGTGMQALDGGGGGDVCSSDNMAMDFHANVSAKSKDGSAMAAINSDPAVPMLGDHSTWTLKVTDGSGNPVAAGTKVQVKCVMTHTGFT